MSRLALGAAQRACEDAAELGVPKASWPSACSITVATFSCAYTPHMISPMSHRTLIAKYRALPPCSTRLYVSASHRKHPSPYPTRRSFRRRTSFRQRSIVLISGPRHTANTSGPRHTANFGVILLESSSNRMVSNCTVGEQTVCRAPFSCRQVSNFG